MVKGATESQEFEESVEWATLSSKLEDDDFEFLDAELAVEPGNKSVFFPGLGALLDRGDCYRLWIRAEAFNVLRSDKELTSLPDLIVLGDAYWQRT